MDNTCTNRMKWINGTLHLKPNRLDMWQPYSMYPYLCIPDYNIPHGSLGYATYQHLLNQGWQLEPS